MQSLQTHVFQLSQHTLIIQTGDMLVLSKEYDLVGIWLHQIHISASHGGNMHCSGDRVWRYVIL